MLPNRLIKNFDRVRLRNLLALFFLALAVPTAVLIWQAYSQLKWEAFHQHRGVAEALTGRIDSRLNEMINAADAQSFADYTFLVVSGEPSAKFVQRSPLSAFPVEGSLPGALGYFQVDADGIFSTPLLPPAGTPATNLGIGAGEYSGRLQLASEIQAVLAENRLVQSRQDFAVRRRVAAVVAEPEPLLEEERQNAEQGSDDQVSDNIETAVFESTARGGGLSTASGGFRAVDEMRDAPSEPLASNPDGYSQQVFDRLNQPRQSGRAVADKDFAFGDAEGEVAQAEQGLKSIGKVSDLKLDVDLQKKSEALERDDVGREYKGALNAAMQSRGKRKEQIALPEAAVDANSETIMNVAGPSDLRITTFESEIDPFEFSLLDGGHLVLFRKVWRDGERYIQGLLLDQESFVSDIFNNSYYGTELADMSNAIVAYQNDVIASFGGDRGSQYSNIAAELDGALLYRNRLSAPFDRLELIFSIKRLPPGPGASVLGWVTLVLAAVFAGGFAALYRTGLSQINLAEQHRDFVSAVSHELKSPLTSIRMYGEMLKEGWADEEKRQGYYEFIHDESERLSRLISNVLQLANITKNEPQFNPKATSIAELMSNTESKISNQIERAGFTLKFHSLENADRVCINIDEDCFAQIIINLVDNAIKFSKNADNKTIEISSRISGDGRVLFSVRDYGPGIPQDQMKKIFQLFYRSESELTRETVGTGIGLAIVHQLTTAMNGSVDMINAEPGAEFRIWFSQA